VFFQKHTKETQRCKSKDLYFIICESWIWCKKSMAHDRQTIRRRFARCACFYSKRKERKASGCNMRPTVIVCSYSPHTACRLRNLADFILSTTATTTTTTTTTSVDDAGLDDSSRTHISQSVRSCGNFDILEYGAMRELVEILRVSPQKLHHFDSR